MSVKFTNNAATTLSSGISSGATSFTVAAATDFPTLGVGDWTYVSLTNEVVKVTAISGGAFTCVATSGAHSAGVSVELRMTSELLNDFAEDLEALPITGGALTGAVTTNSTFDGVDIATRDGVLTTTTTTANAALPKAGGAMTGAITTNSTFDGRDVATDGTKLDNIETSATADQTNAEIKTAVQAATSISLGGSPTTTTQAESDDSTKIATTAYVTDKITTLIGGAPSTLNDLNELANAINDDANYNSTLTTALGTKLPKAGGTLTGNLSLGDSIKAQFGASNDLQIQHTGGNSFITDGGTGQLYIQGSSQIKLTDDTGSENFAVFNDNGAVQLYYDNVEKVTTTGTGVSVTGDVVVTGTVDGVDIATRDAVLTSTTTTAGAALPKAGGTMTGNLNLGDNDKVTFGAGNDGFVYSDGTNLVVEGQNADSGVRLLSDDTIVIGSKNWGESFAIFNDDGECSLYYDSFKKIATTSAGIDVTGNVVVSGTVDGVDIASRDSTLTSTTTTAGAALPKAGGAMTGDTTHTDNSKDMYGTGNDLEIYHDGANSYIDEVGTGSLIVRADGAVQFKKYNTAEMLARFDADGACTLYYDNAAKLATTSGGVTVTGEIYATGGTIGMDSNDYIGWSNNTHVGFVVNGSEEMRLEADGDLHVDGNITAYSTTISDERLKENIQPIEDALSKVNQLKGCTFTYTADGRESAGLIAQDVEKVLPSAVSETKLPLKIDDGNEYKVLQYDQTIGLLVEAIKELSAKVEELEGK